jgi:hypothetical protein
MFLVKKKQTTLKARNASSTVASTLMIHINQIKRMHHSYRWQFFAVPLFDKLFEKCLATLFIQLVHLQLFLHAYIQNGSEMYL